MCACVSWGACEQDEFITHSLSLSRRSFFCVKSEQKDRCVSRIIADGRAVVHRCVVDI